MKALREVTLEEFRAALTTPEPRRGRGVEPLRRLQIVQAAMGVGPLMFGGIVVGITQTKSGPPLTSPGIQNVLSMVNCAFFVLSFIAMLLDFMLTMVFASASFHERTVYQTFASKNAWGERVLTYLTGHVLKDTDVIVAYHLEGGGGAQANRPTVIDATPEALDRVLADVV